MINHFCSECMYVYKPTSIHDFYKKTYHLPQDIQDWGVDYKLQKFWLCQNVKIADVDERNGYILMKPCNNNGHCQYFRTPDAEDIIPSTLSLTASSEDVTEDDEVTLTATMTPANVPADEGTTPNTQSIEYEYRWFKNDRRLWKEEESTLAFKAKETAIYSVLVIQKLADNGDGGSKEWRTGSSVTINVTPKNDEDSSDEDSSADGE